MEELQKAIKIMRDGGIVIFPTDTAFGIGCRIDREESVKRLFELRKRPYDKATPVLTASLKMIEPYLKPVPEEVTTKLVKPYWPGGVTIVMQCITEKVPELISGGRGTLGVRIPDHPQTLQLIEGVGVPIIGTSANFSGEATPFTFESLDKDLVSSVDFVLKGECFAREVSTVIDTTVSPWKILRSGVVKIPVTQ